MHIFFSGIGGTGIGPLAMIAKQAGHQVSGSDKQDSTYIDNLKKHGIKQIHIGQDKKSIAQVHDKNPIDWIVYSSAVEKENQDHPELVFARDQNIKSSKRDELLNEILSEKYLKLVAVAGTHGKTTTTAMIIWLLKELGSPLSYSVGAKLPFGDMGTYQVGSKYFIYEADEYDRNFLSFEPYLSTITGVTWDHHEVFPTREDYQEAFREFLKQSDKKILWEEDIEYLNIHDDPVDTVLSASDSHVEKIKLAGLHNRLDAWQAVQVVHFLTKEPLQKLLQNIDAFPGIQRRMEQIAPGLYSDYAHTVEKIRGAMSVALETAEMNDQSLVVVYEPLHNRRQHYIRGDYGDCFNGASRVYWVPSYLAREDPNQALLTPQELIKGLADPSIARPAELNNHLKEQIQKHLDNGDMVVCMSGGGGNSLDEWIRHEFA